MTVPYNGVRADYWYEYRAVAVILFFGASLCRVVYRINPRSYDTVLIFDSCSSFIFEPFFCSQEVCRVKKSEEDKLIFDFIL